MESRIRKKEIIFSIIDILVIVFLIGGMIYYIGSARSSEYSYPFSSGWIVNVKGEYGSATSSNVDLDEYRLPRDIGRVSEVKLTRLMSKKEIKSSTLRIYSMISDLKVSLDGRKVYVSKDSGGVGIEVSRGYSFIELPHSDKSAVLIIVVKAADDAGLASVPGVVLTDSGKAYSAFIHERWLSILISFFMCSTFIFPSPPISARSISQPCSRRKSSAALTEGCSRGVEMMCLPTFCLASAIPFTAVLFASLAPEV